MNLNEFTQLITKINSFFKEDLGEETVAVCINHPIFPEVNSIKIINMEGKYVLIIDALYADSSREKGGNMYGLEENISLCKGDYE